MAVESERPLQVGPGAMRERAAACAARPNPERHSEPCRAGRRGRRRERPPLPWVPRGTRRGRLHDGRGRPDHVLQSGGRRFLGPKPRAGWGVVRVVAALLVGRQADAARRLPQGDRGDIQKPQAPNLGLRA